MTIPLYSIPRFTAAQALAHAHTRYGITGRVSALPSERDQNFMISDEHGRKFVLKIANRSDARELLDFQHQAMRRVAGSLDDCRVQEIVPSRTGADLTMILDAAAGVQHCVRVMSWIEGEVLARCVSRTGALFESIGASMAKIDAALGGFAHPAMHRVLQWDLRHAGLAREHAELLPRERRVRVEQIFADWERLECAALRHGVIHAMRMTTMCSSRAAHDGLLDFGDMVHSAVGGYGHCACLCDVPREGALGGRRAPHPRATTGATR